MGVYLLQYIMSPGLYLFRTMIFSFYLGMRVSGWAQGQRTKMHLSVIGNIATY